MLRYTVRRVIGMIPTALVLLLMVVLLIRLLPGNIVDLLLQDSGASVSAEAKERLAEHLGIADPLPVQYVSYVLGVVRGDLGKSLWDQRPVTKIILERAPVTAEVALIAIILSVVLSIPVGVISAIRQDTPIDYTLRSISILGISLPNFVVAQAIVIFPAIWWGKSVPFTYTHFKEDPIQNLIIVGPPAAVLGIRLSATIARMTRTTMLEVMQQDYIRTARAKGLSGYGVIVRHALKNALIPVVTLLGLQLAFLVGGSVIIESIFALPGLGRLLIESITQRDYPIVQGVVVVVGFLVMFTNLVVDLSYAYLDPRIRYS
ncbi:MAG: ABC transporter permease [Candidatus Rokubacteria bacterium]|nr:ABC transporter permease [Chloroflexota bacterium]MBM4443277.1 ABC transporter permease [Candidatus Rokubacteria bacterium]